MPRQRFLDVARDYTPPERATRRTSHDEPRPAVAPSSPMDAVRHACRVPASSANSPAGRSVSGKFDIQYRGARLARHGDAMWRSPAVRSTPIPAHKPRTTLSALSIFVVDRMVLPSICCAGDFAEECHVEKLGSAWDQRFGLLMSSADAGVRRFASRRSCWHVLSDQMLRTQRVERTRALCRQMPSNASFAATTA